MGSNKVWNSLLYVSVVAGMLGILYAKQTTVLAEAAVVVLAFFAPFATLLMATKSETSGYNRQVKNICWVLAVVEATILFALTSANVRW